MGRPFGDGPVVGGSAAGPPSLPRASGERDRLVGNADLSGLMYTMATMPNTRASPRSSTQSSLAVDLPTGLPHPRLGKGEAAQHDGVPRARSSDPCRRSTTPGGSLASSPGTM